MMIGSRCYGKGEVAKAITIFHMFVAIGVTWGVLMTGVAVALREAAADGFVNEAEEVLFKATLRTPYLLAIAQQPLRALVAVYGPLLMAVHLAWQISRLRADDPEGAKRLFKSNRDAGLILSAGLAIDLIAAAI